MAKKPCAGCGGSPAVPFKLSLCPACYADPQIREQRKRQIKARQYGCRGCHKPDPPKGQYGLCAECYADEKKRAHYKERATRNREMNEAQLDALIARQRRNLPEWWDKETARLLAGKDGL